MKTAILQTHSTASFDEAVARAAELLRAGQIVALPTETVYGLAANALDAAAVARVFEAKGRPAYNPLIVHVGSVAMARTCVSAWPAVADSLASAFWPGPLTLVLPRSEIIPEIVVAGGPTVGVRWPSHPFIQEVIRACGFPLAVPSANPASEVSPTQAEHVCKSLGGKIPLIIDAGPSQIGIESTVLDLAHRPPRLLRPGMIDERALRVILGEELELRPESNEAVRADEPLRSPGQLPRHYSPKAKLVVWQWETEDDLRRLMHTSGSRPEKVQILAHTHIPLSGGFGQVTVMPREAVAFARTIYAQLHRCDEKGAELIVVEALPAQPPWEGIADRLHRAGTTDA